MLGAVGGGEAFENITIGERKKSIGINYLKYQSRLFFKTKSEVDGQHITYQIYLNILNIINLAFHNSP